LLLFFIDRKIANEKVYCILIELIHN